MLNNTSLTSRTSQNLDPFETSLYDPFQEPEKWNCYERYGERVMFYGCCRGYESIPPHEWVPANENARLRLVKPPAIDALTNLDLALRCAEAGLYVFPCDPSSRKPLIKWGKGSTTDPERICFFWGDNKWPRALIGIHLFKNKLVVLDGDRHGDGPDGVAAIEKIFADNGASLTSAPTILTPRTGKHHYFAQPPIGAPISNSDKNVRTLGINIRGAGGVAYFGTRFTKNNTGNVHYQQDPDTPDLLAAVKGGTVPVLPEFFVRLLQQPEAPKPEAPKDDGSDPWAQIGSGEREQAWAAAALKGIAADLAAMGKDSGRNIELNSAAFRMGTMIANDWIARDVVEAALVEAVTVNGLVQEDGLKACHATLKSGLDAGLKKPHPGLRDQPETSSEASAEKKTPSEGGPECPHDDLSGASNTGSSTTTKSPVVIIRAADVTMRPMEWLWEGHLARGALELTTGLPGVGKSQVQIHFMACASAGLPWPDGARAIEPANVIMVTAEDAIDTQVVPRLSAAGADLKRVHILKCIKTDKEQRQFLLAEDLVRLEQAIKQIGNVGLVCLDPITAYMGGKMDSHKATEVRSQLGPLKDFSERTNVALSAITHPAKNASARAIDHFIGSQAFIAAARIGHACFEEIEEDENKEKTPTGRILFTNVKYSATVKMPTLAYKIESATIYPEPYMQIQTSRVVWEKEAVDISAEQAIAAARSNAKAAAKEEEAASEVVDFLRGMLDAGGGWCNQTEIAAQAKALGFSDKELRTARKKLVVSSKKDGFDGPWLWGWKGKRPNRF